MHGSKSIRRVADLQISSRLAARTMSSGSNTIQKRGTASTLRLVLALALLAASIAGAQSGPADPFGEHLEIRLVNVELFATDREGNPVADLTLDEIEVLEDGRTVEVSHFLPPPGPVGTGDGASLNKAGAGASRRSAPEVEPARLVIFIDNLNTGPASRTRMLEQLSQALDDGLHRGDEVMVVGFDGSLRVLMEFSRNRKELRRTLQEAATPLGNRLMASLRDRNALEDIQFDQEFNADGPCVFVGQLARQHSDNVNQRVQATLAALQQFVGSLAGVPGRKTLLHVSDGVPMVPGAEAWNHAATLCDGSGAMLGVPGATYVNRSDNRFDPETALLDMQSYDTSAQWQRLAALASSHRVVFYPFFASGLQVDASSDPNVVQTTMRNRIEALANKQDTLSILAVETGGQATFSTHDFRPAVRAAIDESMTSYELAYVSPAVGDGGVHSVRVKVDRPGVQLRYRKSYQAKTVEQRVRDGVLSALFYGTQDNPLGASVDVVRADDQIVNGRMKVEVRISLPFENLTLLPKEGYGSGVFTVFVGARQGASGATPIGSRTIPIRVADEGPLADRERFSYVVQMDLGLEPSTVAVGLRDEVGGDTSFLTARIEPPKSAKRPS